MRGTLGSVQLIDDYMPDPEVAARYAVHVAAAPARVYAALLQADLGGPLLVRLLMGIRSLPRMLADPGAAWRRLRMPRVPQTVRSLLGGAFSVLAERPNEELVLGVQGRFWGLSGGTVRVENDAFKAGPPSGQAQAVWSFRVAPERGGTSLTTETRVRCGDPESAAAFRRYWRIVGPFSGLIRVRMLSLVRRVAESSDDV